MTVTSDQRDAQTAEIARLMGLADDEDAAIQQLEADVAAIRRVHVREALDLRYKRAQESVS